MLIFNRKLNQKFMFLFYGSFIFFLKNLHLILVCVNSKYDNESFVFNGLTKSCLKCAVSVAKQWVACAFKACNLVIFR